MTSLGVTGGHAIIIDWFLPSEAYIGGLHSSGVYRRLFALGQLGIIGHWEVALVWPRR